jgi:hypothetical protein
LLAEGAGWTEVEGFARAGIRQAIGNAI